jgi:hypothetical protein
LSQLTWPQGHRQTEALEQIEIVVAGAESAARESFQAQPCLAAKVYPRRKIPVESIGGEGTLLRAKGDATKQKGWNQAQKVMITQRFS